MKKALITGVMGQDGAYLADACLFFFMQNYDDEEIVNIGVGEDITIKALAQLVQQMVGFDGEVIWDASKLDGTPRKLMGVSKLKQLGWQARIDLEQGIRDVYQQYCKSGQDRRFG